MTDRILVLPTQAGNEALLLRRDGTTYQTRRAPLSQLLADVTGAYALLLPGQIIRAFLTDIPDKVRGQERVNMARYAHEDQIATHLDDLHIIVGQGDVALTRIISKTAMDACLAELDPHQIYADFDALAGVSDDAVFLLDRVVCPGATPFTLDPDWSETSGTVYDDQTLAAMIFTQIDLGNCPDLRRGAYRRRRKIQAGPWVAIAATAIVCALLGVSASVAEMRARTAQADSLQAQAQSLYVQATGQPAPDNLARAVRRAAPQGSDPTTFLALSDSLFAAMSQHPDITIERLSFEAQDNMLRLRLIYPDFDAAAGLERSLTQSGASFTAGGVREQSGRFIGDAAIALAGAS